jgi:hypothetical protein
MSHKEIVGKAQFEKARDEGLLLALSNEHNGKNCPARKQLIKCNMNTVVTMAWGPIGEWDVLDNGVMRLESDVCELTLYKTNGMKIHVSFSKGDLRYNVGDWMTMYSAKKMEVSKIF